MNCRARIPRARSRQSIQGVALLVWLGVLAVLAILAAFLLPALIREIDFRVARDESATLKTLGDALKSAVQRHSYIPSETNWVQTVATEAGLAVPAVATNPRGRPRLLLVDTSGWFTNVALPYTQTAAGAANLPVNARMMIASSLGAALPLTNGPLSAGEFSALWQAAEGTSTFPTTGFWAGWNGRSDDVKLERVNLSAQFVSLRVVTFSQTESNGLYSIGTDATLYQAPYRNDQDPDSVPPAYYLQDTILKLYSDTGNLDSTQVLIRDGSFLYQNGVWKSSAVGGGLSGGVDIAGVVYAFLNCTPNTEAAYGADQQRRVVQSMMNYMSNYIAWADGNFSDDNLKNHLLNTVQPAMIDTAQEIFQGSYYPTNASGSQ
jgi:type II secretory pathway pseudopilin PulG